ncbi:MAG: ferritin family protein [Acidimicrobiales bacterium]
MTDVRGSTAVAGNPSPYPIEVLVEFPEVVELVRRSYNQQWNPVTDIPWDTLDPEQLSDEAREAGREFWSLRAWMEHGAVPYGAERLRQAVFEHRPFEIKQHLTNFIREELRHFEASYLIADRLGGFLPAPRDEYFDAIIPKFHDEHDEVALPFYQNLFLNTLFESVSGELLQDRYRNATNPAIKEVCRLILNDEARHIRFGRILLKREMMSLSPIERGVIEEKFEQKLRHSLLRGVYAVTNLPHDHQAAAGAARAIAAEHGLGATAPDREPVLMAAGLRKLRKEVAVAGLHIPFFPEIGDVA